MNKMNEKEILEELRGYEPKTILNIEWNRKNGNLERYYLFCGFDENFPLLVAYEGVQIPPVFFNVLDKDLSVERIEDAPVRLINSPTLVAKILEARKRQNLNPKP